jgi:hypothetical protein
MKAREEARVLFNSFIGKVQGAEGGILNSNLSKQCATVVIDKVCEELESIKSKANDLAEVSQHLESSLNFLAEVKQELNKFENTEWIN